MFRKDLQNKNTFLLFNKLKYKRVHLERHASLSQFSRLNKSSCRSRKRGLLKKRPASVIQVLLDYLNICIVQSMLVILI